eukprot:TRINITY_DN107541_c0_g1_i1.p1 TRINITY_DN107541_c0_g1~~TRINITY_DN107541_c0_g1_i1.p1  ORF type:complete len:228 (+),score=-20.50 TRINITY_DN107541_c0_g1_i1:31-714(+)
MLLQYFSIYKDHYAPHQSKVFNSIAAETSRLRLLYYTQPHLLKPLLRNSSMVSNSLSNAFPERRLFFLLIERQLKSTLPQRQICSNCQYSLIYMSILMIFYSNKILSHFSFTLISLEQDFVLMSPQSNSQNQLVMSSRPAPAGGWAAKSLVIKGFGCFYRVYIALIRFCLCLAKCCGLPISIRNERLRIPLLFSFKKEQERSMNEQERKNSRPSRADYLKSVFLEQD